MEKKETYTPAEAKRAYDQLDKLVAGSPAPYGWLRHPVSGRDPQEGDDDDGDHRFW